MGDNYKEEGASMRQSQETPQLGADQRKHLGCHDAVNTPKAFCSCVRVITYHICYLDSEDRRDRFHASQCFPQSSK